ncbi:phosphopantetheine-binding protein [Micromonospora sp. DT43]|uniref:phosphopantetheine-binding protein n=1 Tax=Micromonospora sp. DT43 TaxID=3393440 RepID=UPI003CF652BB
MPDAGVPAVVADIVADVLGYDEVEAGESLLDLGLDSLAAARIAARLRQVLGVDLPLRAVFAHRTVGDLAATVAELSSATA